MTRTERLLSLRFYGVWALILSAQIVQMLMCMIYANVLGPDDTKARL